MVLVRPFSQRHQEITGATPLATIPHFTPAAHPATAALGSLADPGGSRSTILPTTSGDHWCNTPCNHSSLYTGSTPCDCRSLGSLADPGGSRSTLLPTTSGDHWCNTPCNHSSLYTGSTPCDCRSLGSLADPGGSRSTLLPTTSGDHWCNTPCNHSSLYTGSTPCDCRSGQSSSPRWFSFDPSPNDIRRSLVQHPLQPFLTIHRQHTLRLPLSGQSS